MYIIVSIGIDNRCIIITIRSSLFLQFRIITNGVFRNPPFQRLSCRKPENGFSSMVRCPRHHMNTKAISLFFSLFFVVNCQKRLLYCFFPPRQSRERKSHYSFAFDTECALLSLKQVVLLPNNLYLVNFIHNLEHFLLDYSAHQTTWQSKIRVSLRWSD